MEVDKTKTVSTADMPDNAKWADALPDSVLDLINE